MIKHFIFSLLILTSFTAAAQIRSYRDLVGKWNGPDMQVEFFSDSKVIMIVPGGKLPIATYSADFMQMPIKLKISLTDNGQKMEYYGTLQFLDNNTIKLEYFGDDRRQDAFAKGRTVTLKKAR